MIIDPLPFTHPALAAELAAFLPKSYGGCTCACHRRSGIKHVLPCCLPSDEKDKERRGDFVGAQMTIMARELEDVRRERDHLAAEVRRLHSEVGVLSAMMHPDEAKPRGDGTWLGERACWSVETEQLRSQFVAVAKERDAAVKVAEELRSASASGAGEKTSLYNDAIAERNLMRKERDEARAETELLREEKAGWKKRAVGEDPEWQTPKPAAAAGMTLSPELTKQLETACGGPERTLAEMSDILAFIICLHVDDPNRVIHWEKALTEWAALRYSVRDPASAMMELRGGQLLWLYSEYIKNQKLP